jgi:DNA-binding winged helix-turn-helix (wHTH) protein
LHALIGAPESRGKLSPALLKAVKSTSPLHIVRFGAFQLDLQAAQLLKAGRVVRLKPQPFRLLELLVSRAGEVVTREEIRELLWGADTFVDFEQGVNSAIKQVREALGEDADRPLYVETVPKRGYRFVAPIETPKPATLPRSTDLNLQKALWLNVAELRLAEQRRRHHRQRMLLAGLMGVIVAAALVVLLLVR